MMRQTSLLMATKKSIRSPLRYPGGKQKAIPFLSRVIDRVKEVEGIGEFREPFLGGGCVLLYALGNNLADSYWGNDLNPLLMDFWYQTQEDVELLCQKVIELREPYNGPRSKSEIWKEFRRRFVEKLDNLPDDRLHRAARFFILNRSTASGTTEAGGLTPLAYCTRFTDSSIQRLRDLAGKLDGVCFTCEDYQNSLRKYGENVFIFLDPPYESAKPSKLYGKRGNFHSEFNHGLLAAELKDCSHLWLMTIDNSEEIRDLYSWAEIYPWEKTYGMTNISGRNAKEGKELLVANFKLSTSIDGDLDPLPVFRQSETMDPKKLRPHPLNKEIYGEDDDISDLVESMGRNGFFPTEPILVWGNNRTLQIVSGNRRCRAAIAANLKNVPIVRLRKSTDSIDVETRILDENRHRIKNGLQISREFEHRKRIEVKLLQKQLSKAANVEQASDLAAAMLGYSGVILERSVEARRNAEFIRKKGCHDEANKIVILVKKKEFDFAYEYSTNIRASLESKVQQKTLFDSLIEQDFKQLIEKYDQDRTSLERLRDSLSSYLDG